ncbi:MAG: aldo/keto reductase [Phycisphaerales bacterium]
MDQRPLGRTGLEVGVVGYGAFKIGRAEGIKYPTGYALPDEDAAARLLHRVLDLGVNLIDVAPSYGVAEERIGNALAGRRHEFVLSTKVGEQFASGHSTYAFDDASIRRSVATSLRRLRTDAVDILLVHSDGIDEEAMAGRVAETMLDLQSAGLARFVGFSGKHAAGTRAALAWADVVMVTYHAGDDSHAAVMDEAAEAGVGVLIKKALASGHLPPAEAIPFAAAHPAASSLVIGGLNLDHLAENIRLATSARA